MTTPTNERMVHAPRNGRSASVAFRISTAALALLLLAPGLATSGLPTLAAGVAQDGALAAQEPVDTRIPPRPVEPPMDYQRAVASGTRSPDGRPGSDYWQQRADYRIQAELDPSTGRLNAREVITYHNRSPDTLAVVVLRLEQNVFAEGARRNRRAPITGGLSLEALRVDGRDATSRHVGSSYYESLTLLQVQLPDPLPPGEQADIEVRWSFTVPPAEAFRTGILDGEVFAVAQWYPRVAVYDDVYGWDLTPYLGDGEFYLEYGSFDVQITVPNDWIVAATGTLENPEEVLSPASLERQRGARASDSVTRIVTEEQIADGTATRSGPEELTWRFTASDVRDFSFATSPSYVWEARGVEVPGRESGPAGGGAAGGERALLQAFYRPGLTAWNRGLEYVAHGVTTFSEWLGPIVYPQVTITETSVGGMEYPMLIFNPSTNSPTSLAGVTIHEVAHQWFPMAVGTMEAKHAWMDEGIGSYWEELSLAALYGREPPEWGTTSSYLRVAGTEVEVPLMRHTDLVNPYGARVLAAYTKPALVLGALRSVIGDDAFQAAFRDFYESWTFRHPHPFDFFNTVERHAGEDLDWFWRSFFFETHVLDHAVESVEAADGTTTIRIADRGEAVLPTPVRIVLDDGTVRDEWISHQDWLTGGRDRDITLPGGVAEVVLDPDGLFPDVNRENNRWSAP